MMLNPPPTWTEEDSASMSPPRSGSAGTHISRSTSASPANRRRVSGWFIRAGLPRRARGGHRFGAGQEDAVHDAAQAVVVVDREVPDLAVVPERDRAGFPAEPGDELRLAAVLEQVAQQRQALPAGPAL